MQIRIRSIIQKFVRRLATLDSPRFFDAKVFVSADENVRIVLHQKMNDIADTKTACTLCGHAENPLARMHDENDIQMAAIWNITSSSSKSEIQTKTRCQNFHLEECTSQCESSARISSTILVSHLLIQICEVCLLTGHEACPMDL